MADVPWKLCWRVHTFRPICYPSSHWTKKKRRRRMIRTIIPLTYEALLGEMKREGVGEHYGTYVLLTSRYTTRRSTEYNYYHSPSTFPHPLEIRTNSSRWASLSHRGRPTEARQKAEPCDGAKPAPENRENMQQGQEKERSCRTHGLSRMYRDSSITGKETAPTELDLDYSTCMSYLFSCIAARLRLPTSQKAPRPV